MPDSPIASSSKLTMDVPFGERPSPAIISLNQRTPRSRTGPPSPLSLDEAHRGGLRGTDEDTTEAIATDTLTPPTKRKLCVRHQRMADEGTTVRLQKSIESLPLADQTAVNTVWSLFSSSSHSRRALILQGILTMCCFSQLSLLSAELSLAIRIDPFSLFPREVSLKVLGHLDAISLGRTAQVSRAWKQLADDDLLWRNMCEQHIERKCEKCGWGLPLLSERRRRVPGPATQLGTPESRDLSTPTVSESSPTAAESSAGTLKRAITAAANAAALEKQARSRATSPVLPPRKKQRTRPWKSVYCERLAIERNWRSGTYKTKILTGHTDGIMTLQINENLKHPAFPVMITGSYDRRAILWNLETGEQLRVFEGHTRGVRCLQFDEVKLITGSMDHQIKLYDWRTGELLRTLEGHTAGVVSLHFNEDTLASGSADATIRIWAFRTGECYTLRGHKDWVNAVKLWTGPDGMTFLFSASDDGCVKLWDLTLRECLLTFEGHVGQVQSIKLVTMDDAEIRKLVGGGEASAEQVESMDGGPPCRSQAIPAELRKLQAQLESAGLVDALPLDAEMGDLLWAKQGRRAHSRPVLISGSLDNTVRCFDVRTGRCIRTLFGHTEGVWAVDADKLRIVSASHDRTIKCVARGSGSTTNTLVGHKGAVTCLQLSDDKIVSGSDDGEIRIWQF